MGGCGYVKDDYSLVLDSAAVLRQVNHGGRLARRSNLWLGSLEHRHGGPLGFIDLGIYIYIYICGLVPCSYPPNGMGPQVAPGPFYLQAIGSISEAQPRIC